MSGRSWERSSDRERSSSKDTLAATWSSAEHGFCHHACGHSRRWAVRARSYRRADPDRAVRDGRRGVGRDQHGAAAGAGPALAGGGLPAAGRRVVRRAGLRPGVGADDRRAWTGCAVAVPTAGALAQARRRVGVAPLRALFDLLRGPAAGVSVEGRALAGTAGVRDRRHHPGLSGHPGEPGGLPARRRLPGRHRLPPGPGPGAGGVRHPHDHRRGVRHRPDRARPATPTPARRPAHAG